MLSIPPKADDGEETGAGPDPAREASAGSEDTTGAPSPAAAPAAPSTPGPSGTDAAPAGGDTATAGEHAGSTAPKLFAAALLIAVVLAFVLRRRH